MKKEKIYKLLPETLLPWYRENARNLPWRKDREPYHVWASEIMLQQTRVEAVIGYYKRFLDALPTIEALANVPEEKLLKLWEGLGYYNRVRNMQKAAKVICEKHGGMFPQAYEEIRALPGIGAYTAGAIASICFELPYAAVDGNVLRILSRILANDEPIDTDEIKKMYAQCLEKVYPQGECGNFTQALMELGACICTPKSPSCAACPCASFCRAHQSKKETAYPVRLPKKEKRMEKRSVFLLECDGKYALIKRENKGLLSGLWQLPNTEEMFDAPQEALAYLQNARLKPKQLVRTMERVHIFTHIRWDMTCYHVQCSATNAEYTWVQADEIRKTYALPTAFRMFVEDIE